MEKLEYPKMIYKGGKPGPDVEYCVVNDKTQHAEKLKAWGELEMEDPGGLDYSKMKIDELRETLIDDGHDESDLKGMKKAELIGLLEGE